MNGIIRTNREIATVRDAVRSGMRPTLLEDLKAKITEAALYRGIGIKAEDVEVAARMYMEDLENRFPALDLKEVTVILRNGIRKEYGEFYGINAGTLYDWTVAYLQSDERKSYARSKQQAETPKLLERRTERSQEEVDEGIRHNVNEAYAMYREHAGADETVAGRILMKAIPAARSRYPIGHPLFDPGNYKEQWLHDKGFSGTLREIFEAAAKEGKEEII